ncbi:RlmE/FtsJ family methyltransferase [Candidatus Vidania fulgoroideorum]
MKKIKGKNYSKALIKSLTDIRSISFFKIKEIDIKYSLFHMKKRVLELGCYPGGWTEYISKTKPEIYLVSLDKKKLQKEIKKEKLFVIKGNVFSNKTLCILKLLSPEKYDLIISDVCLNISGIKPYDISNQFLLIKRIKFLTKELLILGGDLLFKVNFEGINKEIKKYFKHFKKIMFLKLRCTKRGSSELYVLCKNKVLK